MEIIEVWKNFISQSRSEILQEIDLRILPLLAGEIVHNAIDKESWEAVSFLEYESEICSVPAWFNGTAEVEGNIFRCITTYSRNYTREFQHYFRKKDTSLETLLEEFFELYQFDKHTGMGNWNLPCTWLDMFEIMVNDCSPWEHLSHYLDKNCPQQVIEYFVLRMKEDDCYQNENLWQYLYSSEDDDSVLGEFFIEVVKYLLRTLESHTVGSLKERYRLNYKSHQKAEEEKQRKYQDEQHQKEKLSQELKAFGHSLIPEFNERLSKRVTLIKPELLYFAKDQKIWPELKLTLNSFSEKERAAIVYVSKVSNSVALQYPSDPYVNP
ncbi:MAG: hypothetical protein ABIQ95_14470 [Bdellovibrionia bacterium]